MNFKKMSAKALSVFMSLLMIFSICVPAVSAIDAHEHTDADKPKLNYVSLGDSMSNGYGLDGYNLDQKDKFDIFKNEAQYGAGAYTLQFEEYLKGAYDVNHSKLAISAMLSRDLLFLLGGSEYVDDDYTGFEDYLGVSTVTDEFLAKLQAHYIKEITNADVITMGVGNAEIGAYIMDRLMKCIGFDENGSAATVAPYVEIEALMDRCDAELVEKVIELRDQLIAELPNLGFTAEQVETTANLFVYTILDFCVNYMAILDRIVELNPDATIIVVGVMNTLNGMKFKVDENTTVDFGEYMYKALGFINAHMTTYATLQTVSNSAYENAEILYAEASNVEVLVDTFGKGELGETVRRRFVETIVGMLAQVGMPLSGVTFELVTEFEADRIAFADKYGADAATAVSTYLAVEKAVRKSCDGATMGLDSFQALGNLASLQDTLAGIQAKGEEGMAAAIVASKANQDEAYKYFYGKLVADLKNYKDGTWGAGNNFYYILYKFVYTIETIEAEFSNDLVTLTKEELTAKISAGLWENYYVYLATEENLENEEWISLNRGRADRWAARMVEVFYTGAVSTTGHVCLGLDNYYKYYFGLYYIPENISDMMVADELLGGLCNFLARCKIGNGIGTHPSANGHNDLFNAVRTSYVEGYRTVDKTVDDLRILCEYLYAHREEIYAQAYKQAEIAGYIAAINGALDNAVAAVKYAEAWAFEYEEYFMGDDFALQINASVESTIATIEALRTLINEAKVLDEKILDNATALLAQLKANVAELATLVNIAAEDAYIYGTEVLLPAVDAEIAKVVEAAMAELKIALATINAQINTVLETVASVEAAVTEIIAAVEAYVEAFLSNKAFSAKYTVSENSYVLAIGEDTLYAEILADMLGLGADQFGTLGWGELDAAEIAKADLITLSYNESLINRFAIEQFRGFVAEYVNEDLRKSAEDYVEAALTHFFGQLVPAPSAAVLDQIIVSVKAALNDAIDGILGHEHIADAVVEKMDWDALVGSENASYVEGAVDTIVDTLVSEKLIVENYAYSINVVELLYANIETIDPAIAGLIAGDAPVFNRAEIEEMFGTYAEYTLDLPVAKAAALAIESYFYNFIKFNAEYAQTVLAINAINPDATIVLLGNYNAFDGLGFELTIGEIVIDLGEYLTPAIKSEANAQINAILANLFGTIDNAVNQDKMDVVLGALDSIIAEALENAIDAQGKLAAIDVIAAIEAIEIPDVDLIELVGEENLAIAKKLLAVVKFSLKEAAVYEDVLNAIADIASKVPTAADMFALLDMINANIVAGLEIADEAVLEAIEVLGMTAVEVREFLASLVDYAEIVKNEVLNVQNVLNNIYDAIANYDIVIDSQVIDLGAIFGNVNTAATVAQSIAAAFSIKNAIYVDIYNAETVLDTMGLESIKEIVISYILDSSITNVSEAGHAYIAEQIFNALYITCAHADANNDHVCDLYCGEVISECVDADKNHVCDICGETISECADADNNHNCDYCGNKISDCADANKDHKCDVCGAKLSDCADANKDHKCDTCGATLSQCADANNDHKCDTCGAKLSECADANNDHKCDVCGTKLTECVDADNNHNCDICGTKVSECADANHDHVCDVCGATLSECQFGEWVVTKEATKKEAGEQQRTCSICGAVESQIIAKLEGMSTGAVIAIVAASVVVAGGIGFAAYWFIFKKKIFAK